MLVFKTPAQERARTPTSRQGSFPALWRVVSCSVKISLIVAFALRRCANKIYIITVINTVLIISKPLHCMLQSFLNSNLWLVSENLFCFVNFCHRIFNISFALFPMRGIGFGANDGSQHFE